MKKIFVPGRALVMHLAMACNNEQKTDSTEVAEEKNEQKADSSNMGNDMEKDADFLVNAASGGLMEVELGQYAATNAASASVKEFGQRMVTDHSKANEELKALAAQKNITIPSTPGEDHQEHITSLKAKKGADFDKDYMDMMVKDHDEDVSKFEKMANDAKDPDIKAFAAKTLPVLKEHQQMAKRIHDGMK